MIKQKNIAVLGSTGSVGIQALDVARAEGHTVTVLYAGKNDITIQDQVTEFNPKFCVIDDKNAFERLKISLANSGTIVLHGIEGLKTALFETENDVIVNAVGGAAGLLPTLISVECAPRLALANKESLVIAGDIVMKKANECGCSLLPVDSEHGAIFQCLEGRGHNLIKKIHLTASGGPFYGKNLDELSEITPEMALAHPTWKMGKKITIDSATLMNKGFEVIEAAHLFGIGADQIEVLIHRESIIHSMVEYDDNSVIAQLSSPDMRLCVQYAINYPERAAAVIPSLDLAKIGVLNFGRPDLNAFPLLRLAFDCLAVGGGLPAVLNAANEVAVEAFLCHRIGFTDIYRAVQKAVDITYDAKSAMSLEEILNFDVAARQYTRELIG